MKTSPKTADLRNRSSTTAHFSGTSGYDDQRKFGSQTSDNMERWKAEHFVFPMICGSGGSKSRLAKAAGAEPCGQRRHGKLQATVARRMFSSQNVPNTPFSEHSWKFWCRKIAHAALARSRFWSQNVQNAPGSAHFWKFGCGKREDVEKWHAAVAQSAFPTQHVKNDGFGPLWVTFGSADVQKIHAVVARSTLRSENAQNTSVWDRLKRVRQMR